MNAKMPVTRISCWQCGATVPLKGVVAGCPVCGARLQTRDYDAAARTLVEDHGDAVREMASLRKELKDAVAKNNRWRPFGRFPLLPSRRRMVQLEREIATLESREASINAEIEKMAHARYYASRWFRASGVYLRSDISGVSRDTPNPFKSVRYGEGAVFQVRTSLRTKEQRGVFGEYLVFDKLSSAIDAGKFGNANLLRMLYIPDRTDIRRDPFGVAFTEELDMLLVTERFIWVIEVKNLRKAIRVERNKCNDRRYRVSAVPVSSKGEMIENAAHDDRAPVQNHRHVRALREVLASADAASVRSLIVYVDNCGFTMTAPQGLGGTWIASTQSGANNLVDVLVNAESGEKLIRGGEEVAALSDELALAYSDVDGSKALEHARTLEIRRRVSSGAGASSGFTRENGKKACGKTRVYRRDDELERMIRKARA